MGGIYLLLPTLLAILVSLLIVRAGAIALTMTGMHYAHARFQALSAFTGTGFTTRAAESVVNHPARRRIASWLMVLGNAGIVTVIITTTSSFVTTRTENLPFSVVVLLIGTAAIYVVVTRTGLARRWERFVEHRLARSVVFEEELPEELLHLAEGYGLARLAVDEDSPLDGAAVGESALARHGFLILGIEREGGWLATPTARDRLKPGDRLVVYGHLKEMANVARLG